ncbi:MAG: hypothetical protein KVP17_004953 [Porospora cf. gigantea B]|uniref:uncharacterized protein n=1 Tax=Porospora cf. gigantea B TaxID=2853592 RepID=UPI003571D9CD|nr:MAG: hypothetical protein KVP17_004953 [Porospora cf. gigantea B]
MNSSSKTRRVNLTRAYAVVLDIALVLLLVFSGLASAAVEPFHNTTSSISNSRPLPIVPAPWAFSIWGIIYAWLLYCVIFWTFMAWRAPDLATVTLSSGAFFLAALALVGTSLWLLLWDCAWLWWSFVVLVLVTGLLAGLVITLVKSQKRHPDMRSSAWRTAGALAVNGFGEDVGGCPM